MPTVDRRNKRKKTADRGGVETQDTASSQLQRNAEYITATFNYNLGPFNQRIYKKKNKNKSFAQQLK